MKVRDLLEVLDQCDPDLEIVAVDIDHMAHGIIQAEMKAIRGEICVVLKLWGSHSALEEMPCASLL